MKCTCLQIEVCAWSACNRQNPSQGFLAVGAVAAAGAGAYLYTGGDFNKLFGTASGPALMEVWVVVQPDRYLGRVLAQVIAHFLCSLS